MGALFSWAVVIYDFVTMRLIRFASSREVWRSMSSKARARLMVGLLLTFASVGFLLYLVLASRTLTIADLLVICAPLLLAVLGAIVSVAPPKTAIGRNWWVAAFIGVGVLSAVASLLQLSTAKREARTDRADAKRLQDTLNKLQQDQTDSQHLIVELQQRLIQSQRDVITKSNELEHLTRETLAEVTGGDSYCYLETTPPGDLQNGRMFSNAFLKFRGKYPIHNLHLTVFNIREGFAFDHEYGTVASVELGKPKIMPNLTFNTSEPTQTFLVFINTFTSSYQQRIRFQKSGDHWFRATDVTIPGRGTVFHWEESGFPLNAKGKVDW